LSIKRTYELRSEPVYSLFPHSEQGQGLASSCSMDLVACMPSVACTHVRSSTANAHMRNKEMFSSHAMISSITAQDNRNCYSHLASLLPTASSHQVATLPYITCAVVLHHFQAAFVKALRKNSSNSTAESRRAISVHLNDIKHSPAPAQSASWAILSITTLRNLGSQVSSYRPWSID
jgi:hypothetical protein